MQLTDLEVRPANIYPGSSSANENRDRSALVTLLDRTIVILMVAILLTLSWPVSVVLWHQSRSALPAIHLNAGGAP